VKTDVPDTTEYAQNALQILLKMNYIFYLNAQNTMKTENQCCLKLQLYVVTLEICMSHLYPPCV
jgi:hypothetical protein